jgi:2-polyprenyl-3-methyl-5-hydroxy-6-metoxy-1,4-benzoquinol methylase
MAEKHTHHHDYAKANAEHFSEQAPSYRTELSLEIAKRCAGIILKNYPFDSNQTEVLDFACGPGLIAFELLPHAKSIVGADLAQGMVDVFNHSVSISLIHLKILQILLIG